MKAIVITVVGAALIAFGPVSAANPRAAWIVFAASPNHGTLPDQLLRVRADGTGLAQITSGARTAAAPSFSPNGKSIVFGRAGLGLFAVRLDGFGLQRLTAGTHDAFPVWSPDGRSIAFVRKDHVYVMRSNGRAQHILRRAPAPADRPSWAPDGNLFIPAHGTVYKVSSMTGRVLARLNVTIKLERNVAVPTVSPNGRYVAYVGPRPSPPNCEGLACEVYSLYIKHLSGETRAVPDGNPAGWSPDSRMLVFAYHGTLAVQSVTGVRTTTISLGSNAIGGDAPPAWQPR